MIKIFKLFRLHEWILFFLMLATVIGQVVCTLTLPDYMSDIVADITGTSQSVTKIWKDGLIMVGIAALNAACAMISNLLSAKLSADFTAHLTADSSGPPIHPRAAEANTVPAKG